MDYTAVMNGVYGAEDRLSAKIDQLEAMIATIETFQQQAAQRPVFCRLSPVIIADDVDDSQVETLARLATKAAVTAALKVYMKRGETPEQRLARDLQSGNLQNPGEKKPDPTKQ